MLGGVHSLVEFGGAGLSFLLDAACFNFFLAPKTTTTAVAVSTTLLKKKEFPLLMCSLKCFLIVCGLYLGEFAFLCVERER